MSLPTEVKLTKDGGYYYRSMAFYHIFTWPVSLIVAVFILLALVNPFWFRDRFFRWVEATVGKIAQFRNYHQYKIYLGIDPEVWHALKDQK